MVGGGIFLTTSTLARQYGAPSLLAGYLVAALGCALTALCYAEFAALEPGAGSAYQYARASLGHFPSWLIGCALFLEYSFGSAAVAVLWTGNPHYAAGMVGAATLLLILGIRVSANVNTALVFLKCGTLVAFIAWILYWATGHPAVSPLQGESTAWRSVAGLAVFSYLGFESVSTLGLECRNPQRDIPIGVIGSLAITTLLYLAVIATYAMVPNPIGDGLLGAALATGAGPVGQLINLCVYVGLSTVLLIMMMGQSRIFFAMASDGLLPTTLRQTHTRTSAPTVAILVTGALVATACLLIPLQTLYNLAVTGTLIAFTVVAAAIPILRRREPNRPRPFRVPSVWITAPAAIIVNIVLLSNLVTTIANELAICFAIACFLWYFARKGITV
jgi:APA family basic amino acid/polyamine antiporter